MTDKSVSTVFSVLGCKIIQDEYVILPPSSMAKQETIGKRLKRARERMGLSPAELRAKIIKEYRAEISESTIRDIEKDKTPNSGRKTVELIALGVGLDPLEVLAIGLDDPPEVEDGYTQTQFAQMGRAYKKVRKEKQPLADELIQMVNEKLKEWC